jgi:pathogenesis-related protein 1
MRLVLPPAMAQWVRMSLLLGLGVGGCADSPDTVSVGPGPAGSGAAGVQAGAGESGVGASGVGAAGASGVGMSGTGGASDAGHDAGGVDPETGRLAGITAAHNAVRARANNPVPVPALPPLEWSESIAQIAQAYAEQLAADGCRLEHSGRDGYGENLAYYGGQHVDPTTAVEGWAGEVDCYDFGEFLTQDACDAQCVADMFTSGCGHYTQVVWRDTEQVGCGVANCPGGDEEIWVCNYASPGNYVGQRPY